jgi:(p)ppGpp synthase/HD superfamily hydrolase
MRIISPISRSLLLDTIEDSDTTPEELEQEFGAVIRDLVMELTYDKVFSKRYLGSE